MVVQTTVTRYWMETSWLCNFYDHLAMAALPGSSGYVVLQSWTTGRNRAGGTKVFMIRRKSGLHMETLPADGLCGAGWHRKIWTSAATSEMNVLASSSLGDSDWTILHETMTVTRMNMSRQSPQPVLAYDVGGPLHWHKGGNSECVCFWCVV